MMNNRWFLLLLMPLLAMLFVACDDGVTYSEMKDKERNAINSFITSEGIKVISKEKFIEQDSVTNCADNEYVLLGNVYVQFVENPNPKRAGYENIKAKKINDGTSMTLLVKFSEYSIMDENFLAASDDSSPDEMSVANDGGSYTASFSAGAMMDTYGTTMVPSGWLVAMPYLYFTRSQSKLAEVNLIVPHSEGTTPAANYVYPCFYNIKFQPEQ